MFIYLVNTPTKHHLVRAKTNTEALKHALGEDGYSAKSVNATELAVWLEKGLKIETVPEPVKKDVPAAGHTAHGHDKAA